MSKYPKQGLVESSIGSDHTLDGRILSCEKVTRPYAVCGLGGNAKTTSCGISKVRDDGK